MNLLYRGRYRARFRRVLERIGPDVGSVCELCFGDTFIAEACRDRCIRWTGVDVNPSFCDRARRLGFPVIEGDLMSVDLPNADVYLMVSALYHFHDDAPDLFDAIFRRTRRLIVFEPVRNLSSSRGLLGGVARTATDPGTGPVSFRYDESSLLELAHDLERRRGLAFDAVPSGRDLLVDLRQAGEPHTALSPRR
jgi:hypothetical protein